MKKNGGADVFVTVLAPVAWGTTYVTVSELLPTDRPLLVAAGRVLPAGLLLIALGRWRAREGAVRWGRTMVLALCNFALFFPLLTAAAYRLPGGVAAAVGGVQPILVAVLTWVGGGGRPRRTQMVVGLVAAGGVAMVVVRPDAHIDATGVLFALAANVSFAVGVVLTRRWGTSADALRATGHLLLVAAVVLVPLAIGVEGRPPTPDAGAVAGLAYLSLVATGAAFVVWFRGVRRLPAAGPPLLGLAGPVTGAVLGWAVLDQSMSAVQVAGLVVTLGAISWGATAGARPAQRPVGSTAGGDPAVRPSPVLKPAVQH